MSAAITTATHIAFLGDAVQARFLKEGDVVERHQGHIFEIGIGRSVKDDGRLVFSAFNEQGGILALTIHPMVEVSLSTILD